MIEQSDRLVVVADGSKLGQTTMASVAPAQRISLLITDRAAPQQELVELEAIGVEIVVLGRPGDPAPDPEPAPTSAVSDAGA
jgi:DeoR/GlpR family transcriptional regulator of sugar metabolism